MLFKRKPIDEKQYIDLAFTSIIS